MSGMEPLPERHPAWNLALRLGLGTRGEAFVKFLDEVQERKEGRAKLAFAAAAERCGNDPQGLFDRIEAREELADLLEETLRSAGRTRWRPKVRVLGQALAVAVIGGDDAAFDHGQMLASALADVEPAHAHALWLIGQKTQMNPGVPRGLDGWLAAAVPAMQPIASQVAGVLNRHGLVSEPFWANGVVGLTVLGRELLEMLIEAGGLDEIDRRQNAAKPSGPVPA